MTDCCTTRQRPVDPLGDADAENEKSGQAQPGQGRLQPPVLPAVHLRSRGDHGPAPVHHHADRARRLGPDLEPARRRPAADPRAPAAAKLSGRICVPPSCSCARSRGNRSGTRSATRGSISACPHACSPSGCGAPAATCSAWYPSSATSTPIRTGPTWPASSMRSAPAAAGPGKATRPAVPARYLLACAMGHLDEFPYDLWVHRGRTLREGRDPDPEDDRPDRGQGRVGDDPLRVLR